MFTFKNKCGQVTEVWSITGSAHSRLTQNKKEPYATLFDLRSKINSPKTKVYDMILTKTKIYIK